MRKSFLGQLRENRSTFVREGRQPLKEMFGGDGELITLYGRAVTDLTSVKESLAKRQESILGKYQGEEVDLSLRQSIQDIFDTLFTTMRNAITQAETQLKGLETGGQSVASLGQPQG